MAEKYIYICSSPLLRGYKIGYHTGTPHQLFKRYQTAFTNMVYFTLFTSSDVERDEAIIHRILAPYRIANEVFSEEGAYIHYCFIAKAVTGCDEVMLYSKEKYGFTQKQNPCQYYKREKAEQDELNFTLKKMSKADIVKLDTMLEELNINDDQELRDEEELNKLLEMELFEEEPIKEELIKEEPIEEKEEQYPNNPFSRWAYRGTKKCYNSFSHW